jgi:hypothetical protein
MIRFAAVAIALLCLAAESQAQWQPFGGRFRHQPCQPYYGQCQPQFYYGPTCPPPVTYYYYSTPQYVQPTPYTPVVPSGPKVVPAPNLPETPKVVVPIPAAQQEERTQPQPRVTPKDTGPRVLPAPKRNEG